VRDDGRPVILDHQQLQAVGQAVFMGVERLGGARLPGPGEADGDGDEKTEQVTG